MAQLDITGFVTPEQEIGLDKLAQTIALQNAAKAKGVTKKSQLEVKVNPADYATGTIYNPYITKRVKDLEEKGIKYAQEHPDATALDLQSYMLPYTRALSDDSEKLKVLKAQRDAGLEIVKKIPGADPVLFDKEFNIKGYKTNPDGTLPDDLSGIDVNTDYVKDIIENSPIWNAGAIDNLITKAGSGKSRKSVLIKDANKASRATDIEIESPLHMNPVLDQDGHFTGDFEMPNVLYTEDGQVKQVPVIDETTGLPKKDVQGNEITEPVKMITTDDWETVKNDVPSYSLIKQEIKKQGLDPDSVAGQNYGRSIAFKLINSSSKAKTKFSEVVKQVAPPAPVTKVTVINKNNASDTKIRDLHTPAVNLYQDIQDKKDKIAEMIKQGKTDSEISNEVGLKESAVKASRKGRNKARMPLNYTDLDIEFVNSIEDLIGKSRSYKDDDDKDQKYDASTMAVELNNKGNWEVYSARPEDNYMLLGTVPKTSLNWDAQSGAKPKQKLLDKEKGTTKKSALDAYSSDVQYAITEYAKSQKITIEQAISKLKAAKKI